MIASVHTLWSIFHILCLIQNYCHCGDGHQFWPISVILYFRFSQGRAVVGEDDQFRFALSDYFQSLLVAQHILSTFINQLEPRVD